MTADDLWTIPRVAVAVDLAVFTVQSGQMQILLVRRGVEPFRGALALPGGFIASSGEDIDAAAARELVEETGLASDHLHLEQLRTYGAPHRDPRGRVVTVCYLAFVPDLPLPVAGGDAQGAKWMAVDQVLRRRKPLAFDHAKIIKDAVERARSKLEYTTLATRFCAPVFTITELRQVYEIVWGQQLDPRNFHRKVTSVKDFLVPTGEYATQNGGRPAMQYHRGSAALLHPAILRGENGTRLS
jgi:8-oxo-dGTP diphosphatase